MAAFRYEKEYISQKDLIGRDTHAYHIDISGPFFHDKGVCEDFQLAAFRSLERLAKKYEIKDYEILMDSHFENIKKYERSNDE